jgi:hypothetical protein
MINVHPPSTQFLFFAKKIVAAGDLQRNYFLQRHWINLYLSFYGRGVIKILKPLRILQSQAYSTKSPLDRLKLVRQFL